MNTPELKPLTKRQQEIFDFVLEQMSANGAPPTRVEIADHFGFRSPNAAEDHLKALDKKGHIELKSGTSRGIFIREDARPGNQSLYEQIELTPNDGLTPPLAVIGDVAAGAPIFATQHVQQYVNVDQSLFAASADFLLKVRGDSMINAGIFENDLLAIKKADTAQNNQIVVARIDDDVTVKRYFRQGTLISLVAENEDYDPIEVNLQTQSFAIEGVVVGLIRRNF
ncbi:transcriptional repressor LexA [Arenicella xantha]|uniref:LexA repressor n=1 Tax=Arenicella xantha TaxID=644221 RepID=A0A395JHX1_9GAMM|nr:transcriptional repressor LexA [Arenicella xantha]RBP48483.1 SOS-response transcriptional repressor LexA [Arenicella xantha]